MYNPYTVLHIIWAHICIIWRIRSIRVLEKAVLRIGRFFLHQTRPQWHLVGIEVRWINVIQLVSVVSIEYFAWQNASWERFHWFHGPLGFQLLAKHWRFFSVSLRDPKLKKLACKFDESQHMWEKHRKPNQRQRADDFSRPTQRSYCKTLPELGLQDHHEIIGLRMTENMVEQVKPSSLRKKTYENIQREAPRWHTSGTTSEVLSHASAELKEKGSAFT